MTQNKPRVIQGTEMGYHRNCLYSDSEDHANFIRVFNCKSKFTCPDSLLKCKTTSKLEVTLIMSVLKLNNQNFDTLMISYSI